MKATVSMRDNGRANIDITTEDGQPAGTLVLELNGDVSTEDIARVVAHDIEDGVVMEDWRERPNAAACTVILSRFYGYLRRKDYLTDTFFIDFTSTYMSAQQHVTYRGGRLLLLKDLFFLCCKFFGSPKRPLNKTKGDDL